MKTTTIEIREPFWGAGSVFGWEDYSRAGVGIEMSILRDHDWIKVCTRDKEYEVECAVALKFIKERKSTQTKKGTKLGVIPMTLMTCLEADLGLPPSRVPQPESPQQVLF